MATITKKELIDRIAEITQAKRVVVKRIVQSFLDEVIGELAKNNRLEFRDFGVFETRARASRIAQNPKTLQRVSVPTKRTVKFKMGRVLKQKMAPSEQAADPS
jgi:integration host factor subunit beta